MEIFLECLSLAGRIAWDTAGLILLGYLLVTAIFDWMDRK